MAVGWTNRTVFPGTSSRLFFGKKPPTALKTRGMFVTHFHDFHLVDTKTLFTTQRRRRAACGTAGAPQTMVLIRSRVQRHGHQQLRRRLLRLPPPIAATTTPAPRTQDLLTHLSRTRRMRRAQVTPQQHRRLAQKQRVAVTRRAATPRISSRRPQPAFRIRRARALHPQEPLSTHRPELRYLCELALTISTSAYHACHSVEGRHSIISFAGKHMFMT
jgi:hypothetical protein